MAKNNLYEPKEVDYQAKINEAVKKGDLKSAAVYENLRNKKIDTKKLGIEKTYNYIPKPSAMVDMPISGKGGSVIEGAQTDSKKELVGGAGKKVTGESRQNNLAEVEKLKSIDYQALINEAVSRGDYASAAKYEDMRNAKIDNLELDYQKTDLYNSPKGVDEDTYNRMKSTFNESDKFNELNANAEGASNKYKNYIEKDIISSSTQRAMNKSFKTPTAVKEADVYLANQLEKIQSGKTSYSDQVKDAMDRIMNREKFSYDVDTDPLFQQALSSAINSGKTAMQDTIGQASALTGGYGSTYATTAGNQAYNAFIEDAYNNLPQYYQMAMEAYQMEGDEMYRQLGMLNDADDKEYNRNITAYDATYQHRNQMYNEAYTKFRDEKNDAFAEANLEMQEYAQKSSNYFNQYTIASDLADKQYEREYSKWADQVNNAMQYAQMMNSDWWNQTYYDEDVRQYEKNFAEDVRQFDTTFAENQRQYNETMAENKRQFDATLAENQRQFNLSFNASGGSSGGTRRSGGSYSGTTTGLTQEEKDAMKNSTGVNKFISSVMSYNEFLRHGKTNTSGDKQVRYDNYNQYIDDKVYQWNKDGKITEKETEYLIDYYFTK